MNCNDYIFVVTLERSQLLEDILGDFVVQHAWQEITSALGPKFHAMFSRYENVEVTSLEPYTIQVLASHESHSRLLDVEEQKTVLIETAQTYVREAFIEFFGAGSGRKIDFKLLFKEIGNRHSLSSAQLHEWLNSEAVLESDLSEKDTAERSPHGQITKNELLSFVHKKQLQIYAQEIIDLSDDSVVGYEVLTRGPQESSVERADKLFGSASYFGLTKQLELACIEQALDYLGKLPSDKFLTINLGPEVLASDELSQLLQKPDLHPYYSRLCFELTEHLPLIDVQNIVDKVKTLQDMGIRVLLDDTGCGFFDISTAEVLKPAIVKLCISVIRRIDQVGAIEGELQDTRKRLDELGAQTLGEGVEEVYQADTLKRAGVKYAQGYLFSKPRPILEAFKA